MYRYLPERRRGFTIAESIMAMALVAIAMGMAMAGWLRLSRGEKRNFTQSELDMDVRKAIERVQSHLRLSALEEVVFYRPPGAEYFTAMSFPLAEDNDGDGLIEMEGGTNIIWDKTVIYHVWKGDPEKLLCTTFYPRDNTLSLEQRRRQIATVVAEGKGDNAVNGAHAKTETVFQNLFDWKLWPKGSKFDAYSSFLSRDLVSFGSIVLTPGAHQVTFKVTGKHSAATGYKIGLDFVRASPSGSDREAEWQAYRTQSTNISVVGQCMTQGSWSDNYQLFFNPATSSNTIGQSITLNLENDVWEEHTFRTPGGSHERTSLKRGTFGSSYPDGYISVDGTGYTWYASAQTATNDTTAVSDNDYDNCAVRVLVKGTAIQDGGYIAMDGRQPSVLFYSPSFWWFSRKTRISGITIAVADDSGGYDTAMNVRSNTIRTMSMPSEIVDGIMWATLSPAEPLYPIERTNTYAITFYISALGYGLGSAVAYMPDPMTNRIHSYVLRNAALSDTLASTWSNRANLEYSRRLPCIAGLVNGYLPANGVFTSGIFDTVKTAPTYLQALWNMNQGISGPGFTHTPGNTAIRFQVRTGNDPYLTNSTPWTNAPILSTTNNSLGSVGNGRYVQFRATLITDYTNSPLLQNAMIRWQGETRLADIGAMVTRGPEYGEFEVMVDGTNLCKGIRIDLTIFRDILGVKGNPVRMTSSMMAEIEPRNSGR